MKDGLDARAIARLADNLKRAHKSFDLTGFISCATTGLESLELKARVDKVAEAMAQYLPADYPTALAGIVACASDWNSGDAGDALRGFAAWPLFVYIEKQGLEHCAVSLAALRELTHLFTAEFALRPFLKTHPEQTLAEVLAWTQDPSDKVRRLASEGIRPRLPWACRLPEFQRDPAPVLRVLDKLIDDNSDFVCRSVANNLADIAVDHPDLVIRVCRGYLSERSKGREWIARRATRNLIKSGHPGVWSLHGLEDQPKLRVEGLRVEPSRVRLGEGFAIDFDLVSESEASQRLVVDFVVHHVKASGKTSPKVFKLSELSLPPQSRLPLSKNHAFRPITTRTYYPGVHRIEIQVNGERHSEVQLELMP